MAVRKKRRTSPSKSAVRKPAVPVDAESPATMGSIADQFVRTKRYPETALQVGFLLLLANARAVQDGAAPVYHAFRIEDSHRPTPSAQMRDGIPFGVGSSIEEAIVKLLAEDLASGEQLALF